MSLLPIKILSLITLLFTFPIIFTHQMIGNFGDIYQYAAPFRSFASTALKKGVVPLWNPYIFAGTPFLASPQSALFYPLTNLFYFIPTPYAFNFFSAIHILLNAVGMFLLLRTLERSQSASLWGSIVWSFSFFFLSKCPAGHMIHLSGYSWSPFVLCFGIRALNIVTRTSFKEVPFLCLLASSVLQFFSGHIQVWLLTHIFLISLWLWKIMFCKKTEKNLYLQFSLIFLAAFICISSVQGFPTFTYLQHSSRFNSKELFNTQSLYDFATSYSMNWADLTGLLIPDFWGSPIQKNYTDPSHPSVYFETNAIYFGIFPLLMALAAFLLALRKKKFFLPLLGLLFIFLATGKNSPIYNAFWESLGSIRVPARFYFLTFIALIFMASSCWDQCFKSKSVTIKLFLIFITLLDLLFHGKQFLWSENHLPRIGKSDSIEWLQLQTERSSGHSSSFFRIFSTEELGNHNKPMFFQIENVNGYEAVLQNSLLEYFINTQGQSSISTTGVDVDKPDTSSFHLTGTKYLLTTRNLDISWPKKYEQGPVKIYENPTTFFPAQALFAMRTLNGQNSIFRHMSSGQFNPGKEILRRDTKPYASFENGSSLPAGATETLPSKEVRLIYFKKDSPNRILMRWKNKEPSPFWIFLSEAYYPGWEAWSESGRKMVPFQANGYFQGALFWQEKIPVEKAYWLFHPKEFYRGIIGSLASIVLLTAWAAVSVTKKIKDAGKMGGEPIGIREV